MRKTLQLPMAVEVELATHQLNHRRLRSLDNRTPCQLYHDPATHLQLHGASRRFAPEDFPIFRDVFEQFWYYLQCMPDRKNRHTVTATWRLVVETWLRRQGWISVKEKQPPIVSTHCQPFCSQH